MTITFFSNFLNLHQLPLCQEFIKIVGEENFRFVATNKISEERTALGYEDMNEMFPFVIKDYNQGEASEDSHNLALSSDIAIFTPTAFHYCEERLKENKICFLYIERQFKRGVISLAHPRVFKRYFGYQKYRNKPLYILCAGAFVASDLALFGFPKEKCFKWGYFPAVNNIDIKAVIANRESKTFKMMWCARFIDWKRPELAIRLARDLKAKGYGFILDMYGNGNLLEKMKTMASEWQLVNYVKFHGSVSNDIVLEAMRSHDVFLFTSNKREGWGAVANEAMANGCTLIASDDIGAIPYLIESNITGMAFKSDKYSTLLNTVEYILKNPIKCQQIAFQAYKKIQNDWTAETASRNLLKLYNSLTNNLQIFIKDGPCSRA